MLDDSLHIENIQRQIADYQKKIQHKYRIIHNEDLEDHQSARIIDEINQLKESVYSLQNKLKEMYRNMFSGSRIKKVGSV
jgi:protein-arginine kinase activator protein McsA